MVTYFYFILRSLYEHFGEFLFCFTCYFVLLYMDFDMSNQCCIHSKNDNISVITLSKEGVCLLRCKFYQISAKKHIFDMSNNVTAVLCLH